MGRSGKALLIALLIGVCLALGFFLPSGQVERGSIEATGKPNIVFILTDDLDLASVSKIPALDAYMADEGVTFDNAFVTESLCCPSRASILTGQYPHNHLIRTNPPPLGGFETFRNLKRERSTVATWLDAAGYETALFGKYLNCYDKRKRVYVPPGWDEWYGSVGEEELNQNGHVVDYPASTYLDDALSGLAQDFVRRQEDEDAPFFLYLSVHAPHVPAEPDRRHRNLFKGLQAPRTSSFDEADLSDKPDWVRAPPLDYEKRKHIDEIYRNRLRTMTAVGKESAYEEDIRIPLMVRGPGVPAGVERDEMVLNNDFAPTFASLAGLPPTDEVDGRSFAPLLDRKEQNDPASWRTAFEISHWAARPEGESLYEVVTPVPAYRAVRTQRYLYVEYGD